SSESDADFTARLAASFRMPAIGYDALKACPPAFDILPYAEAMKRGSVVVRDSESALLAVLGDPFDAGLIDAMEERIGATFSYRLAHRQDIAAYLTQQEESLRAMDSVESGEGGTPGRRGSGEDLSLQSIGDTGNPVVKLISSTL